MERILGNLCVCVCVCVYTCTHMHTIKHKIYSNIFLNQLTIILHVVDSYKEDIALDKMAAEK